MKKSSIKRTTNVNLEELKASMNIDLKQIDLSQLINGEVQSFCHRLGLLVVEQFMQAEVEELLGRKYSRDKQKIVIAGGSQAGSVVVGVQKAPIAKPRVRARLADGSSEEIALESYAAFNKPESMNKAVLNCLLSGVSLGD